MGRLVIILSTLFLLTISCKGYEKFPVSDINAELENSGHPKIVVFMPSVSDSTEYASMIVQAFKNYFVQKLAFNPEDRSLADIDIILTGSNNELKYQSTVEGEASIQLALLSSAGNTKSILMNLFDTTGMYIKDTNDELLSKLNITPFGDYNDSSVLFLLDKDNNIVWRDNDYRGQGEHLKPLEYKIKELLGMTYPRPVDNNNLKVGDQAPDIILKKGVNDGIRVLTFYPAAYSGVFDVNNMARRISMERTFMMSCAIQISSLDKIQLNNPSVRYYAISESTPEILNNWKAALGTHHIQYINDADYSIASAFGAYNPEGYCNRITVIIDKNDKIAYLDNDYKINKEAEIQKVIKGLELK
ncbi:MAG: redoxin domain-containing protein [Dysgonomonas sp.]